MHWIRNQFYLDQGNSSCLRLSGSGSIAIILVHVRNGFQHHSSSMKEGITFFNSLIYHFLQRVLDQTKTF